MNAVFYKISTPAERDIIDSICSLLAQRDFTKAEEVLINYMSTILEQEFNTQDETEKYLSTLKAVYLRFNENYLDWAEKNGKSKDIEIKELQSEVHDNFLFANMSDPESMDDLVYALAEYLTNVEDDEHMEEAYNQLSCYLHN